MVRSDDIGDEASKAIRGLVSMAERQLDPGAALRDLAQACLEEGARLAVIARFHANPHLAEGDLEEAVNAETARILDVIAEGLGE